MSLNRQHVQDGLYLQVLRSTMFFTVIEASSMFPNMTAEQWMDFESGRMEPPKHVLKKLNELFAARNNQIEMVRKVFESVPGASYAEFWHRTMDEWMAIDEREPEQFRVVQSVNAQLATEFPTQFKIYPFDHAEFTAWAGRRPATDELQAQYLGMITSPRPIES